MIILTLDIKPISTNALYLNVPGKGRVKSPEYRKYREDMGYLLPMVKIPSGLLSVGLRVHLSNPRQDLDNTAKPILDILQEKYGFDDKVVYSICLEKIIVPKGRERIEIHIKPYTKYRGEEP